MTTATDAGILTAFITHRRNDLPGVLGDAWRDGYTTATAQLQPVIDRLQDELDQLHQQVDPPVGEPKDLYRLAAETVHHINVAEGRRLEARRTAAMDRLGHEDPALYREAMGHLLEGRRAEWLNIIRDYETWEGK